MRRSLALAMLLAALAACSPAGSQTGPLALASKRGHETPGGIHWLSAVGLGFAQVECGAPWVAIAGGAASPTATDLGTGYPGTTRSSWAAYSADRKARVVTYALCAPAAGLQNFFYRRSAGVKSGTTTATVSCNAGDLFIMGWAYGEKWEGPSPQNATPSGWTAGGATTAVAVAECATKAEWTRTNIVLVKGAGSGHLYVGCGGPVGDTDDVLGGSFGSVSATGTGIPGPPLRQYPGNANGVDSVTPTGFNFVSKAGAAAWVACQEDS